MCANSSRCGASIINIPDTVGFSYPSEFGNIFKVLIENVKSDHEVTYSAHCHDDLGLAVANSMAAIEMVQRVSKVQ